MQEFDNCTIINEVKNRIVEMFSPEKIILFHRKAKLSGATESFKLCVIVETDNKSSIEKSIYINIDCDVPFDAIVYTPDEWRELLESSTTFAYKVSQIGRVIYE